MSSVLPPLANPIPSVPWESAVGCLGVLFLLLSVVLYWSRRLAREIALRRQTEQALHVTQAVVDRMSDAAYWSRSDGRLLYVNAAACRMMGYTKAEFLAMSVKDFALEFCDEKGAFHWCKLQHSHSLRYEGRHQRKNGEVIPVEIQVDCVEFHGVEYTCALVRDITERKQLHEALREQAIRDSLTGLFNRRYLDDTLPRVLGHCDRSGEPLTLVMADLDHFKRFNDDYGHDAGDTVLRAVGTCLRRFIRDGDIACRYGGEEMILILPGVAVADVWTRIEQLRLDIAQLPLYHAQRRLPPVTMSIGVASANRGETDTPALLSRVDAALYLAKANGRDQVALAQ